MKIGEVIVNLRKQRGMKQKHLAEKLGISPTHLSLIEHGANKPSVQLLAAIAGFFEMPVTALVFMSLDKDELQNEEQRRHFKIVEPYVDALMQFLLSDEPTSKEKDSLARPKRKPKSKAVA